MHLRHIAPVWRSRHSRYESVQVLISWCFLVWNWPVCSWLYRMRLDSSLLIGCCPRCIKHWIDLSNWWNCKWGWSEQEKWTVTNVEGGGQGHWDDYCLDTYMLRIVYDVLVRSLPSKMDKELISIITRHYEYPRVLPQHPLACHLCPRPFCPLTLQKESLKYLIAARH